MVKPNKQAVQRLQRKFMVVDTRLACLLTILLVSYTVVSFLTFLCIPSSSLHQHVEHSQSIENANHLMIDHPLLNNNNKINPISSSGNDDNNNNNRRASSSSENLIASDDKGMFKMDSINNILENIHKLQQKFPVHVGDDMEVIEHPGTKFSKKGQNHPPVTMKVPKFWNPPEYAPYHGVREYLGNHGKRLMTPDEAHNIGSYYNGMKTIYASIANYRDPECVPTLESIYLRAKYPERLRVAIIDQKRTGIDSKCSTPEYPCSDNPDQALCKYRHLMDFYDVDAILSIGPVFARHLAHRMYRGEYYAMQVDSHVRFTQDWDVSQIEQWESAKNEMCVLTTYLSDIHDSIDPITHESKHLSRPIMCKSDYEGSGNHKHLRHGQQPEGPPGIHGEPTLHPFWAAGFSFARGHFVVQVPYDQYLPMVFQGEEISIGLRGFTYGYDYYTQEKAVCFHMYAVKDNEAKRKKVSLFWENTGKYSGSLDVAMKRLNGIIGMGEPEYYSVEEEKYGLGHIRQPDKFFTTFGIHTDIQKVEDHLCRFVGKPMMKEFKPHLRSNGMGINYDDISYVFVDPDKKNKNKNKDQQQNTKKKKR